MRKISVIIIACLLAGVPLMAQNNKAMLPVDSPVYGLCKSLFLEQGLAVPFPSYPWSEEELLNYLGRIDKGTLSTAGKKNYARIEALLVKDTDYNEKDRFYFDGAFHFALESYLHGALWEPEGSSPGDYSWKHGYAERLPMITLALQIRVDDWLYCMTDLALREEHQAVDNPGHPEIASNHWNLFDPGDPYLDLYFPFRAYTSLGGSNWSLEVGRDKLSWGNGNRTNLILSDSADYFDLLSFCTFWDNFKYSIFNISLEPYTPQGDRQNALTFLGHRFEAKLFDRVNLALFETITSTLTPDQFFKELNHMNIYHNWLESSTCYSIVALEFGVNPWKFINVYGQAAMDEFKTAYEAERTGGGGAAKVGLLAGIEGYVPLGERYLHLVGEWSTTDPYLYHRRAAPYHYAVRKTWSLINEKSEFVVSPIGHYAGPDVVDWFFSADFSPVPQVELGFELEYIVRGETTVYDPYLPEGGGLAPTGTAVKTFMLHLQGEYSPWSCLTTGSHLYFINTQNTGHVEGVSRGDIEWVCYVKYRW